MWYYKDKPSLSVAGVYLLAYIVTLLEAPWNVFLLFVECDQVYSVTYGNINSDGIPRLLQFLPLKLKCLLLLFAIFSLWIFMIKFCNLMKSWNLQENEQSWELC